MRTKEEVLSVIEETGVVAVIRADTPDRAKQIVKDCIAGGIRAVELTFTVPFAHRILEDLSAEYGSQIVLGAGSVLDAPTARIALLSGAEFVVSPHFDPETVRLCNRYRAACMAGIATVREAVEAMEAGVEVLKLFPAGVLGPGFIKDLHGPLPYAKIMPTGGVSGENAGEWIKAGAVAVGAGSSLTQGDIPAKARHFLEQVKTARAELAGGN